MRRAETLSETPAAKASRTSRRRPTDEQRPPAPWGSFPLVELVILFALVLLGAGLFVQGRQGVAMILGGLALGVLGGTEVSIREHFSGYRSHSTLLAGMAAAIVVTFAFLLVPEGWARAVPLALGVVVFGGSFYLLREGFKRRSGGLGFK